MGAVGGAIMALMNNNKLKLPIPGVPASIQVGVTALVLQKALKPKGMLGKALEASIAASGAVFGYGLANKFGPTPPGLNCPGYTNQSPTWRSVATLTFLGNRSSTKTAMMSKKWACASGVVVPLAPSTFANCASLRASLGIR